MEGDEATELVARLRARLAEHESAARSGSSRVERLRRAVRGRRPPSRRSIELTVGAVALAIAAGAAVFAFGAQAPNARTAVAVRHSPTSVTATATSTTSPMSITSKASSVSVLLGRLPASWRAACRDITPTGGRTPSALACAPDAGTTVAVRQVRPAAAERVLARMVPSGARPVAGLACSTAAGAPRTWSTNARPDVAAGVVECFRTGRGAQLLWSLDHEGLIMRAIRPYGDSARLFAWWMSSTF